MNKTLKELLILLIIVLLTFASGYGIVRLIKYIKNNSGNNKSKEVNINFEEKLKALLKKQITDEYKIINDKSVNNAFDIIKKRLSSNIENNPYNIEILVVDSPEVNALCFPGGLIVVFSGLVKISSVPEEIAGVIAHELGHVQNRDSLNAVIRELGLGLILTVITGGDPSVVDKIVKTLISSKFSREAEKNADSFAVELMIKSGINPVHLAQVFKKFREKDKIISDKKLLTYITTHPNIDDRISEVENKSKLFRGSEERFNINWKLVKSRLE